jgi:hypothetical protein
MTDNGMVFLLSLGLNRIMFGLLAEATRPWAIWSVMAKNEARPA